MFIKPVSISDVDMWQSSRRPSKVSGILQERRTQNMHAFENAYISSFERSL